MASIVHSEAAADTTRHATFRQPFDIRASLPNTHILASHLFHLMSIKQSNLCVSADVRTTTELLELAEIVGDSICMLKTHADIIDDFGERTIRGLTSIAKRKRFLVFEDRKFGDIGSTVQRQYTSGPLRIVQWASIVNAHVFPGVAIIRALRTAAADSLVSYNQSVKTEISAGDASPDGLANHDDISPVVNGGSSSITGQYQSHRRGSLDEILSTTTIETRIEPSPDAAAAVPSSISPTTSSSPPLPSHPQEESSSIESTERSAALNRLGPQPIERGLLLLAEMSSEGNLLTGAYTTSCVAMARAHSDFVVGLVAQRALNAEPGDNFLTFTPGVSLPRAQQHGVNGASPGDGLGQQYNSPRSVVLEKGADVIIVGRGILSADDRLAEAERYRSEAWKAYEERVGHPQQ
ncbi:MAG: hypothetical protein M1825_002430 [Sarcosagium campestre]|nr:MAG: hypothetical protein M1825_002430 [Sarcosagium campestre]